MIVCFPPKKKLKAQPSVPGRLSHLFPVSMQTTCVQKLLYKLNCICQDPFPQLYSAATSNECPCNSEHHIKISFYAAAPPNEPSKFQAIPRRLGLAQQGRATPELLLQYIASGRFGPKALSSSSCIKIFCVVSIVGSPALAGASCMI